jgi:hypothetical protein
MSFIQYYWQGKGPLWKVYWLYGVLVSVGLAVVIATAAFGKLVAFPGLVVMILGLAIYTVWILVSVWRCAENVEGRPLGYEPALWTALSRSLTVAWAINVLALSLLLIDMTIAHPR